MSDRYLKRLSTGWHLYASLRRGSDVGLFKNNVIHARWLRPTKPSGVIPFAGNGADTHVVQRLWDKGIIEMEPEPNGDDRRWFLTEKGKRMAREKGYAT